MKIIHIITGLNLGGAENVLYRLVRETSRQNEVIVVSLGDQGILGKNILALGVNVITLNLLSIRHFPAGLSILYCLIRNERPDVVQTWLYHSDLIGGVVAKIAGVDRIYWNVRNARLSKNELQLHTLVAAKMCAFVSWFVPTRIISCSIKAVEVHSEYGYSRRKFTVIPNGYDLKKYSPDTNQRALIRKELDVPEDCFLIGMVARHDPQKDHNNMFLSLRRLKLFDVPFVCVFVGDEITTENVELWGVVRDLKLENNVRLLGERNDIPSILNAIDIHVLSSVGEAFPNVLAEAMSCGIPCVTTDVGDARLIVGDTGWIVPAGQSEDLARAMFSAYEDKQNSLTNWCSRKKSCRNRIVSKFSLDKMIENHLAVWS